MAQVGDTSGRKIALLLDCDERMAEAFTQEGYHVERGRTGFTDGKRSLPIPLYDAAVVVYDLRDPLRFCPLEGTGREWAEEPDYWRKYTVPLEVPDEERYLDPLSPVPEVAGIKYQRYRLIGESWIEDTTEPIKLGEAREAVRRGVVHICFLNRRFVRLNGAPGLYEWVVPGLGLRPTQDTPGSCQPRPADVWKDFFVSAASPIVVTLDAVHSKKVPETREMPSDDEGCRFQIDDGELHEAVHVQPILVNRAGRADALMIWEGKGAVFLLPEFEDNAAAAVRLAEKIWPKLALPSGREREHSKRDSSVPPQRASGEGAEMETPAQARGQAEQLEVFEAAWDFLFDVLRIFRAGGGSYLGEKGSSKRVLALGWEPELFKQLIWLYDSGLEGGAWAQSVLAATRDLVLKVEEAQRSVVCLPAFLWPKLLDVAACRETAGIDLDGLGSFVRRHVAGLRRRLPPHLRAPDPAASRGIPAQAAYPAPAAEKLPDCPCGRGKWEFTLSQKKLAAELGLSPGTSWLRHKEVKAKLGKAGAIKDGKYAYCTACKADFYRTEFGIGVRKAVKRNACK